MKKRYHEPVLLKESIEYLNIQSNEVYVDATAGFGGHTDYILKKIRHGKVYCIEQDNRAYEYLKEKYKVDKRVEIINDNFGIIGKFIENQIAGILYDLGVSSFQLDTNERGFAFKTDALLDMRMSLKTDLTAYEVINTYSAEELSYIIKKYGEEKFHKRISNAITEYRKKRKIKTTYELADLIRKIYNIPAYKKPRIDPATKTFQAIRIYINKELEMLTNSLESSFNLLKSKGRMVVISYHSLEDRIVKRFFKSKCRVCKCNLRILKKCICGNKTEAKILTKKPIIASETEININRRARSAKLRCLEKI